MPLNTRIHLLNDEWFNSFPPIPRNPDRELKGQAPVVVGQKSRESLRVELVVAEVERRVDRLEGLEVDVDLLFLALVGDDGAAVDDQAVGRNLGVELEPVLDRSDGAEDRQPVDS